MKDKDPNCKRLSRESAGRCELCYHGYYVDSRTGSCQILDPLCKTHNLQNGGCESCYPGYQLDENARCVTGGSSGKNNQNVQRDPYCVKYENQNCIRCANGYYLTKNSECEQVNPLCKTSERLSGDCLSCYSGYVLADGGCYIAQQIQIPYCEVPAPGMTGKCEECITGYYPGQSGDCQPVSILCGDYDRFSGKCLSCIQGYVLQRGDCIYPALGFDANCREYEGAYCADCARGFYLENYLCQPVDGRCIDFDYRRKECHLCANGMTPSGAKCV